MARPGESSEKELQSWEEAKNTPYGKYPELITYTLGKMIGGNRSNMPERDTYEDNVYTRYLRECLNIQNKDVFEAMEDQYTVNVDMVIDRIGRASGCHGHRRSGDSDPACRGGNDC